VQGHGTTDSLGTYANPLEAGTTYTMSRHNLVPCGLNPWKGPGGVKP
jgi:hypothetical protein